MCSTVACTRCVLPTPSYIAAGVSRQESHTVTVVSLNIIPVVQPAVCSGRVFGAMMLSAIVKTASGHLPKIATSLIEISHTLSISNDTTQRIRSNDFSTACNHINVTPRVSQFLQSLYETWRPATTVNHKGLLAPTSLLHVLQDLVCLREPYVTNT